MTQLIHRHPELSCMTHPTHRHPQEWPNWVKSTPPNETIEPVCGMSQLSSTLIGIHFLLDLQKGQFWLILSQIRKHMPLISAIFVNIMWDKIYSDTTHHDVDNSEQTSSAKRCY